MGYVGVAVGAQGTDRVRLSGRLDRGRPFRRAFLSGPQNTLVLYELNLGRQSSFIKKKGKEGAGQLAELLHVSLVRRRPWVWS